jgi:hypothetical protein
VLNEKQISWLAGAVVGLATTALVGRLLNPKAAVLVGPPAGLLAHRLLDQRVAGRLQRALA